MPSRLLGGLGAGNAISDITSQQIHPDIIDTYLVGVGSGSWPTWNSPVGAYITYVSANVKAIGVFAIVFSAGASTSASITTDGGQFARMFQAYLANPVPFSQRVQR